MDLKEPDFHYNFNLSKLIPDKTVLQMKEFWSELFNELSLSKIELEKSFEEIKIDQADAASNPFTLSDFELKIEEWRKKVEAILEGPQEDLEAIFKEIATNPHFLIV